MCAGHGANDYCGHPPHSPRAGSTLEAGGGKGAYLVAEGKLAQQILLALQVPCHPLSRVQAHALHCWYQSAQ